MSFEVPPLFFDHFGFLIWIFIIYIAAIDLKNRKIKNKFPRIILLLIGILGIILDGSLLILFYLGSSLVEHAWIFDHLGIPVFLFTLVLSLKDLKNKSLSRNKKSVWVLLILSILGLIADGYILFQYYNQ